MKKEIWKDIPGYEGLYQVSNWGQVKSIKFGNERILKACLDKSQYLGIVLSINGKRTFYKVHQLVAITFLGHIRNGMETVVNHIDNNPLNNHLDNLELVTSRYNNSCHKTDVGVGWYKALNKWWSTIYLNDKNIHLGYFTDKQEALDMYQKALANTHLYNGDNKAFRLALATVTL